MAYFQNKINKKNSADLRKIIAFNTGVRSTFFHAENDKCVKQAGRHSCSGKKHRGRMRKMRCLPQGMEVLRMDELRQTE